MTYLFWAVGVLLTLVVLWALFIAIMVLRDMHAAKTLTSSQLPPAMVMLVLGWCVDWLFNWVLFSLLFLELPKSWGEKISERTKRHRDQPTKRGKWSRSLRKHFMGPFDKSGAHS